MIARPCASWPVTMRRKGACTSVSPILVSGRPPAQGLGEPVADQVPAVGHVVGADMLDPALARGEDHLLAPRRVDQLVVEIVGIGYADLPVVGAVGDQEG